MWKATFTALWSRKLRLAMSTLAIVLGVAFVSGSFIFSDMIKGSFDQIAKGSISDVEVTKAQDVAVADGKANEARLTPDIVTKVSEVSGVSKAHGVVSGQGVMMINTKGKAMASFGPPSLGFNWITAPAMGGLKGITLESGHAPQADDQIVVDPGSLKKSGWKIGDTVKVITPEQGTQQFTIVGTGTFGEGGTAGASYTFFTTKKAQELFVGGANAFTSIWTVTDKDANRAQVAEQVQKLLPEGYQARDGQVVVDETAGFVQQSLGFINTFLLIFAGISLLVATFLIINTFTILVAQRSKELALYRSMGASRSQIRNTVLVEALVTGLIGSVAGLFFGIVIAFGIKFAMSLGGWDIGAAPVTISPTAVIVSLLTGLLVTLVASLVPAMRATRIAPIEAMTAAKTEQEKGLGSRAIIGVTLIVLGAAGILLGLFTSVGSKAVVAGIGMALVTIGVAMASPLLGRPVVWLVGKVYRALFGEVGKLAELNSVRQPRRTAATASALMIGLTLVSTMAILGASMTRSITEQVENTMRGDFLVGELGFKEFPAKARKDIAAVPEVQDVYAMKFTSYLKLDKGQKAPRDEQLKDTTGTYWGGLGAMEPQALDKIFPQKITQGRAFNAKFEMIMEEEAATKAKLKIGDTVNAFFPEAQRQVELKLVGLFSKGDGIALLDQYVSTESLTDLGLGKGDNFLSIYTKPGVDKQKARDALDKAMADLPLVSVMDVKEYTDMQLGNVQQVLTLIYALLALSIIIAVLGIVNTLGLSIVERTREIGLLRAVALTRPQVRRMITLESVVISLLGAVVGVGLGTVFGIVMQRLLVDQGINLLGIAWSQLVVFVVAAGLIGVLAALWPAFRASRTNILEAIAAE